MVKRRREAGGELPDLEYDDDIYWGDELPSARTGTEIGTEPYDLGEEPRQIPGKANSKAAAGQERAGPPRRAARRRKIKKQDLHKAILQAAEDAGAEFGESGLVSYLQRQALAAPSPFLTLLGKVLASAPDDPAPAPVRLIELVPAVNPKAENAE